MDVLIDAYRSRLVQIKSDFVRYLMRQINWNNRLFAIVGARGTGKTTLLLQYILQNLDTSKAFYMSLDDLYFSTNRLVDVVRRLRQEGKIYI